MFRAIEAFRLFDLVYILTGGGPGGTTETLSYNVYKVAFFGFDTGRASAYGMLDGDRRDHRRAPLPALPQPSAGALGDGHAHPARRRRRQGHRGRDRRPPPIRRRRKLGSGIEIVLLAIFAIVMLFPVLWMLETALKDTRDIYAVPAKVITGWTPTLDHVKDVFSSDSPVFSGFKNSIIVATASTIIATVLGVPAAWAYSRFQLKAKKDQLFFILSTRFMPPVVVVIPVFLMFRDLQLLDTLQGLILVYAAFNLPFTIWMMKGFIDEVPAEYEEAAMLDGYSRFEAFWRVTMPLLIPGIAATAVFALIFSWNEFVFSIFLITDPDTRTAPSAIAGLIGGTTIDWGLVAASAMIFAIPVLVFAFLVRKHLVAGVTLGAVRR